MNMKNTAIGLLLMGLLGSAAAEPIDRSVLFAFSPAAYQAISDIEVERGNPFESREELTVVMATDDFQVRMRSALKSFCSQPENEKVLACAHQAEFSKQ